MKNILTSTVIITVLIFIGYGMRRAEASDSIIDSNLASAIQILETNKPMFDPWFEMNGNTPEKQQIIYSIYSKEIEAVNLISKEKIPGGAKYLIPYINYKCKDFTDNDYLRIGFSNPQDTNYTRSQWPVFSSILDVPGAAKDLRDYALDKKNPANFRFAAFCALRYLSESECKSVGSNLSEEFANLPKVQLRISAVENGRAPFNGAFYSPE